MKQIFLLFIVFLIPIAAQSKSYDFNTHFPVNALVIGTNVHVRTSPDVKSKIIAKLDFGTYVQLLEISYDSDRFNGKYAYFWLKVQLGSGKTGWVWGKYLVYFYPKQQDFGITWYEGSKVYKLRAIEVKYPPYIDYKNSQIPGDINYGIGGNIIPFFMANNNPYDLRFIRRHKTLLKKDTLENYWQLPIACCGVESKFSGIISTQEHVYLKQINESKEEFSETLFTLETADKNDFYLKSQEIFR